MSAIILPLLAGGIMLLILLLAFVYTLKSGQYDDLEGPAYRILEDDDDSRRPRP